MVILIAFEDDCDNLIPQLPLLFDKKKLKNIKDKTNINDQVSLRNAILMQNILVKERNRNCYLSKTSMQLVGDKYKFMCKFKNAAGGSLPECSIYPTEIFEDCLYLSNAKVAKNDGVLQTLGITHILNVSDCIPNYFEDDGHIIIQYANIDIEDTECSLIDEHFEYAYNFIDQVLSGSISDSPNFEDVLVNQDEKSKNKVKCSEFNTNTLKLDLSDGTLAEWHEDSKKKTIACCDFGIAKMHKNIKNRLLVHCAMGKSRSATIILMYIMKKFQLPYTKAFELVKERREKIDINSGFVEQLKEFELNGFKFKPDISDRFSESTEGEERIPNGKY